MLHCNWRIRLFVRSKPWLTRTATHCIVLQRTATHYNTLQHTATHCNTLQHTAIHYRRIRLFGRSKPRLIRTVPSRRALPPTVSGRIYSEKSPIHQKSPTHFEKSPKYFEKSPIYSHTIPERFVQQRVGAYTLERIPYVKTAQHILKRVLYILKRAPYILILSQNAVLNKEWAHILWRESHMLKQPYIFWYIFWKEPHIFWYFFDVHCVQQWMGTYMLQSTVHSEKSTIYSEKRPIYSDTLSLCTLFNSEWAHTFWRKSCTFWKQPHIFWKEPCIFYIGRGTLLGVLQCVEVCCSVLHCVAVCCSVLQCVAVCCSMLQYVAVCCSALQRVAVCCIVSTRCIAPMCVAPMYSEKSLIYSM